jgi:hypothetical protein
MNDDELGLSVYSQMSRRPSFSSREKKQNNRKYLHFASPLRQAMPVTENMTEFPSHKYFRHQAKQNRDCAPSVSLLGRR